MRNLNVGGVLSSVADLYRRGAVVLLGVAAVIYAVVALITAAVLTGKVSLFFLLLSTLLSTVAAFWYQALVVALVREVRATGRVQPIGELLPAVRPRIGAVLGIGVLAGIAVAIGFILIIVPGLFLLTIWALIVPVLIVERGRALDAFKRSRSLVKGNAWQVFGVIVIVFLITFVVQQIFRSLGGTSFVGLFLTSLIPSVLVAPIGGLAASIMYFELRELKGEPAEATLGGAPTSSVDAGGSEATAPRAGGTPPAGPEATAPRAGGTPPAGPE